MEGPTKNLCAQIPQSLHARVRREQEAAGQTLGQYMAELITKYYEMKENGGTINMEVTVKTLALQIPEDLMQRLKDHLAAESKRTGKKISQKEFVLNLIRQALDAAAAAAKAESES